MDDDDSDLLLYLVFGAAILYFLYKNNIFGVPAASGSGGGQLSLPPASGAGTQSGASAPVAAATQSAANQGPASGAATPLEPDFGMAPGGWDD